MVSECTAEAEKRGNEFKNGSVQKTLTVQKSEAGTPKMHKLCLELDALLCLMLFQSLSQ